MTTVVLGLDGAGFELLDPWIEEGSLPTLKRLTEEGIAADLRSCRPPVTCPNWKCYSTGKNPGKLGVFWWEHIDTEKHSISLSSSSSQFDGKDYWELMQGPVACINLPTSYPPKKIDGINVAGGPGAEQQDYTEPESFADFLKENYDYRVHPSGLSKLSQAEPENETVEEIRDLMSVRLELLKDLINQDKFEFIHLSLFYINMLQHFYFDHEVVKDTWKILDTKISDIIDLDSLDDIYIISDHGSNRVDTWFRINSWLIQNGYLVTNRSSSILLHKLGINKSIVRRGLNRIGIEWWARSFVPDWIQDILPTEGGEVKKSAKERVIDWEESRAVASGQGPVYLIEDDPDQRQSLVEELRSKLTNLTAPDGSQVISQVHRGSDVYTGKYSQRGPDLVLDQAPHVHIDGGIGSKEVFDTPEKWSGENTLSGLFIAHGPNIRRTSNLKQLSILDIAPTVLHTLGYSIPDYMDGSVRKEIFADGSRGAIKPVSYTSDVGEENEGVNPTVDQSTADRLSDLGYLE